VTWRNVQSTENAEVQTTECRRYCSGLVSLLASSAPCTSQNVLFKTIHELRAQQTMQIAARLEQYSSTSIQAARCSAVQCSVNAYNPLHTHHGNFVAAISLNLPPIESRYLGMKLATSTESAVSRDNHGRAVVSLCRCVLFLAEERAGECVERMGVE
jgi:hypothetical protein